MPIVETTIPLRPYVKFVAYEIYGRRECSKRYEVIVELNNNLK
ncbi:MAG: hypothetical protein QXE37_04515 [Nitrososphaerales archaeon]